MSRIDSHAHFPGDLPGDLALLEELDLQVLNVCIPRPDPAWRRDKKIYRGLATKYPGRYAWCGGFQPPGEEDFRHPAAWASVAISEVLQDLQDGAVGIKVWKSIGMEIRKADGSYLMIDDPIFTPVFAALADANGTLLTHIGEPLACWRPLTEDSPHAAYYARHPEWHMAGRPGFPSHAELIAARDRLVEKHPDLRIVGAHLASLEYDVEEVSARLARFPNFAVDISSRLLDLARQDRHRVHQFFSNHSDRILFGSDLVQPSRSSLLPAEEHRRQLQAVRERWQAELAFIATDELLTIRGREVRGLGLGESMARKLCEVNPRRWYPRLAAAGVSA